MSWMILIGAGIMEVLMVIALKNSAGFSNKTWSAVWFLLSLTSLFLLSLAIKEIPLGTAYGVWTGIGAMGSVVVGMIFFHEKVSFQKIVLITLIIVSIIGLKLV